jgi:N-acetylgalactosamine-N,N'-diacetylbacillosaminyl-diphospho-undecaprenol 4-alpha-N-acetylgalactosaminyltransferase
MKQKLLISINALRSGGAERVVSVLMEQLKEDFEIHLAVYTGGANYSIPKEVTVYDLGQPFDENEFIRLLKLPYLSYKLYKYAKKHEIPVSVAFLNRACYLNALIKFLWGYKGKVVMCQRTHLTTILKGTGKLYSSLTAFLIKQSFKKADLILTNAIAMKEDLKKNFDVRKPIDVIYNPIDVDLIKAKSMEPIQPGVIEPGIFNFIIVGGFRKEKNQMLVVEAMGLLKSVACKLILCGDGVFKEKLQQRVAELGIGDKIIFHDFDTNPYKLIKRSDCLVLSSDVEGFPNVLLEALACGMPIISTDCKSGPREMLAPSTDPEFQLTDRFSEEEFGVLTPVGNAEILAKAMQKMVTDATLRNRLRDKAEKRSHDFDVSKIMKLFRQAFEG